MFSSASASPLGGLGGLGASWNLSTIMKTSGITADVQQHLARVYATLAGCVLSAALAAGAVLLLGSRVDPSGWMGMLSFMVTMGGTIWLHSEPVHNHQKRVGILMAVAASLGVTTSSLIAIALDMDPSILVSALYVFLWKNMLSLWL
jgi:FtsH-binding integral membrane protein